MKKILITLLSMLLIVCTVAFVACGNKTPEIADWTDQTIEIGYGETYNLNLVATDTENNVYTLTAEVETENGDKVEVNNGKFVVTEKCDYIIMYSLALEKETLTRTVTAKVVGKAAPVIRIEGRDTSYIKGMTIAFPKATVYDYFDGENLTYSVSVYKKTAEGKTAVEFDKENNKFTATETGEYCFTYSSTNVYGSTGTADRNFKVKELSEMLEIKTMIDNSDVTNKTYMSKVEWQAEGLTGDYDGNAYKFYQPTGGINNGFKFSNEYNADVLDEIKASGVNKVVLPVAFDFGGDATLYLYNQGFEGFANPGETRHSAAIGNLKTWLNWEISIDDFKTLLAEKDYEFFRPWYLQDKEGAYVTGSTNGTGYTYYFGELSFVYREPTILKVTSGNYSNYFNPDVTNAYISATRLETLDIDGNYSGDATQFMIKGKVTNAGYRVRVPYTEQELIALKENYNTVTMWLSATGVLTNSFNIDTNYTNTFATLAGAGGFGVTPKWQRLSISMDKFISIVDFEKGVAPVLATAHWSNGTYSNDVSLYFGDMYFEYIEPTILKVNADNYTSYYNTDGGIPRTYVSAEDLATLNILGEYTGNAVRFDMSTYKTNGGYKIKIPYTEQELLALKSKYNTVSTYVAITGVNGGKFFVDNAASRANYIANLAGYTELSITPTWQKISITIDQLITSMNSTNATVKDYCPLIATSGAYATYDTNVYMYFGDMIFENIVSE